jgi:amino acid transporter
MVVVGFFWVHGGIYGNEAMLMAGPPLFVFILLGIVPFVYSLPIALIVAELSSAFPEDGGYVVWVKEACGKSLGSHHAYWVWVIYVVDAAIYPVLVANYVDTMVPMGDTSRGLLALAIVVGVTIINLLGTDVMVKFNTLLAIVSLAPTLVFMFLGMPTVSVERCLVSQGDVDWTLLVSWILWLYCGFFSLGTLAGELENPRRTFTISIAILFPAVLLLNTLPLAVALGLDDRLDHYSAGYFNVLAGRLAGAWLDGGFQVGANVCLVGLYNAAVITAERSLAFLVSTQYGDALEEYAASEAAGARGRLLRPLLSTSKTGVAPIFILVNAVCAGVLVWMPYTLLVEFSMLLSVPSILLFMWSFVALRIQRPFVERPFLIPGGLPVAGTLLATTSTRSARARPCP